MRPFSTVIIAVGLVATFAHSPANAQVADTAKPVRHVNDKFSNSFFDLHPELTKAEFKEFAAELGSVLRFRQLGDSSTLGRGVFEISADYARTSIDGSKGAWNNTMSHPAADHSLGQSIAAPRVVARFGVSDRVDIGAWGTLSPHSNYGIVGIDSKIALMKQGPGRPISIAIRPSISSLVGPSELWAGSGSIDVSFSRSLGLVSPYVGFVTTGSLAVERSADVDLKPATASTAFSYAGISLNLRRLVLSGEVQIGRVTSYGIRVGTRF